MELTEILSIVTFLVTLICGFITKKRPNISNKIIPIQNLAIGIIMAIIEWIITKDLSTAIMVSGLLAGGVYDLGHNIKEIFGGNNYE